MMSKICNKRCPFCRRAIYIERPSKTHYTKCKVCKNDIQVIATQPSNRNKGGLRVRACKPNEVNKS